MQATAMFSPRPGSAARFSAERSLPPDSRARVTSGNEPPLQIGANDQVLTEAVARAERAERRLRSRLAELTWPAALCGIVGGFLAIVGLRLAGM